MRLLEILADTNAKIDPNAIGINHPVTNANTALQGVLNTVYGAAGIVCVIIIIVGGYIYVTSSGDSSNIKRAKEAILGAVIGIVMIIMAFAITQFITGRLS